MRETNFSCFYFYYFDETVHTIVNHLYILTLHFIYFGTDIYASFPFANLDWLVCSSLRCSGKFFDVDIDEHNILPKDFISTYSIFKNILILFLQKFLW